MTDIRFDGKVAIVTGAGNGLGRSHALALAARGARVLINDLGGSTGGDGQDQSVAEQVAAQITEAGGEALANGDNVLEGHRIVEAAMDTWGRVDILINNAGILRDAFFHRMTQADWTSVMQVHQEGAFRTTHAAWPHMRSQGSGRVIFTASQAGIYGNPGQANYCAAKLSVNGLARSLASEGGRSGILVNTIAPIAASRLTESVMPKELLERIKPEMVSPLVLYLVSEDCPVTGKLFEVGGGYMAMLRWERSGGATFAADGFMPEDVASQWNAITSFDTSDHPETVLDGFEPMSRAIGLPLTLAKQS